MVNTIGGANIFLYGTRKDRCRILNTWLKITCNRESSCFIYLYYTYRVLNPMHQSILIKLQHLELNVSFLRLIQVPRSTIYI